jgi:hypothetical protein
VTGVQIVILTLGTSQGDDPFYAGWIGAIGWLAAGVAMNHGSHAFLAEASTQPANLSGSHSERRGGRTDIEDSSVQAGQDLYFALLFGVQGYCPHTLSMRTFSLSSKSGHYR